MLGEKMNIAGIMGFAIMVVMSVCLLNTKWSPGIIFIAVPVIAGVLAGASAAEIAVYVWMGMKAVLPLAIMFSCAVIFFGLLNETGMFIYTAIKMKERVKDNKAGIFFMTVFISVIAHLSGSGMVSYLIVITACRTLYEQKGIPLAKLMCLSSLTFGVVNMVPWAGPCGRVASALQLDAAEIWRKCIPSQLFGICLVLLVGYILSKKGDEAKNAESEKEVLKKKALEEKHMIPVKPDHFMFYVSCMAISIVILAVTHIPPFAVFMVGSGVLMTVDFKGKRKELLLKYLYQARTMTFTVLASGFLVGIVTYSPMLGGMTEMISCLLPQSLETYPHILLGIASNPISWVLSGEAEIFGLLPIAAKLAAARGIAPEITGAAFLIPYSAVVFVLPATISVHLGLSMCNMSFKEHAKETYRWSVLCSIGMLAFAVLTGVIPL